MARVKLCDVIVRANTKVDKDNTELIYYVGGEHFESGNVTVENKGLIAGSTIGPMFYYGFKKGQFLLVSRNPHLRKAGVVDFDGICSEKTFVLESANPSVLLPEYLPFVLQNDKFWEYAIEHKHGSTNFFINWATLASYEFELPELSVQRHIAELAWAAHRLKKSYQNQILATDELVKSQFIELFSTKGTEPLSAFANICAGQSAPSDDEYSDTGTPFIKAGNLENLKLGIIEETDCYLVSEETVAKRKLKLQKAGSVLVAKSGMSCLSGHIYALKRDAYVVSHLACIRAKDDAYVEMVKWHFIITGTQGLIKNPSYPAIQIPQFENMPFPRASKAEAETFAAFAIQSDKSKLFGAKHRIENFTGGYLCLMKQN